MPNPFDNSILSIDPELSRRFQELGDHIRDWSSRLTDDIAQIAEGLQRITSEFPENIRVLADNGWFISSWHTSLPGLGQVARLFAVGEIARGHELMCGHFASVFDLVSNELLERHSDRAVILSKAYQAHRIGDYELSVPVFLAQADGIAKEMLGVSVYTRRESKRKVMRDAIGALRSATLNDPMLELVLGNLPLTSSTDSADYCPSSLNRHAIIHGIDLSYGTELDSFRAFSWLQYASQFKEAARWCSRKERTSDSHSETGSGS